MHTMRVEKSRSLGQTMAYHDDLSNVCSQEMMWLGTKAAKSQLKGMVNQVDKLMVSYTLQAKSHLNLLNENDGREDATQNWKDKEPRFILLEREAELQTSNTSVICVVDHSKMLFPVLMTDMVEMLI